MKWTDPLSALLILGVSGYQRFLSPLLSKLGVRCRFHPTCSQYAILAIRKYGPLRGMKMALYRLYRCRPDNTQSCIDYP